MKCAYDSNGDKYDASDFEEPSPVEWEVWGTVEGVYVQSYRKGVDATEAEEAFREFFESEGCVVQDDVMATISEWQT